MSLDLSIFNKNKTTSVASQVEVSAATNDISNSATDNNIPSLNPSTEVVLTESEQEEIVDTEVTSTNPISIPLPEIQAKKAEYQLKPVDQKKAQLDFYKHYAYQMDSSINEIIIKHGTNTEAILDELECRILQYQRDQKVFRTYEEHTRLRRAILIKERQAEKVVEKRKSDLNYVPSVGNMNEMKKARKAIVKSGLNQKEKLIRDLVAKGLSEEQAKRMLG